MKWTAWTLLLLVLLMAGYYTKAHLSTEKRLNKEYDAEPLAISIINDSVTLAKGKHLVKVKGCDDCHASDLGGKVIFEKEGVGRLTARNLTAGKGGLPAGFSAGDWVLAVRHGLRPDKKPLIFMPADDYNQLAEDDLQAIISYLSQIPKVNRKLPPSEIGPGGRVLNDLGMLELFAAEKIDHKLLPPASQKSEVTREFGKYVALICTHCHQPNMKGTPGEGGAPDISSTGPSSKWTDQQFYHALRKGSRPDGTVLKAPMPWQVTSAFSDTEMKALRLYLKSI